MGTKMVVAFANLFMAAVETEILRESTNNHWCRKGSFISRYLHKINIDRKVQLQHMITR